MSEVEISISQRVMVLRLNRPEKKNAFKPDMLQLLQDALRRADSEAGVGCVVLTGAGDAFCSGADLGALGSSRESEPTPVERKHHMLKVTQRVALAVEEFEKPLIAAVNGAAVGAGMDLALMCDMRFAASSARFSEGYVRVGLLPGMGGCHFLPRLVGTAKALELLLTGRFVAADEALRIGLVNHVHPDDRLMEETLSFATELAAGPPIQQRDIKRLTYQGLHTDLRTSLESVTTHSAVVMTTTDHKEAVRAFREKRRPVFQGK